MVRQDNERKMNRAILYLVLAICLALPYKVQRLTRCLDNVLLPGLALDHFSNGKRDYFVFGVQASLYALSCHH